MAKEKTTWEFFIVLDLAPEALTEELLNKLYVAGCSDATFSTRSGKVYATFSREAVFYEAALGSALLQFASTGVKVRSLHVIDEDSDTIDGSGQTPCLRLDVTINGTGYQMDVYDDGKHYMTECRDFPGGWEGESEGDYKKALESLRVAIVDAVHAWRQGV